MRRWHLWRRALPCRAQLHLRFRRRLALPRSGSSTRRRPTTGIRRCGGNMTASRRSPHREAVRPGRTHRMALTQQGEYGRLRPQHLDNQKEYAMMITKRGFICLAACLLAASLFARHHHHKPLPPQARWCEKCDGDGYYWTWYGWRRTCEFCGGSGYVIVPPPPPFHKPGHHGAPVAAPRPAPKPAARPGPVHKPAPYHAPAGKVPTKGGPRR